MYLTLKNSLEDGPVGSPNGRLYGIDHLVILRKFFGYIGVYGIKMLDMLPHIIDAHVVILIFFYFCRCNIIQHETSIHKGFKDFENEL